MIENKKLGMKIAETEDEALWQKVKEARESSLKQLSDSMKVERVFLEAANSKLRELKGGKKKKN